MKTKPPTDRRKFADKRDEMGYLYDKLIFWLYQCANDRLRRPFSDRLECLLKKANSERGSIFTQECWSLVQETKGNLAKAIAHREKEVQLIRRLHELSENTPDWDLVEAQYNATDLSDRLDLLATLYHDFGKTDRAILTLHESKQYCADHGIEFDGEDILQECLEELDKTEKGLSA